MSTKNKSITSQALLEMDSIREFVKEESKDMLKSLLSEAVKDYIRESVEDEDEDLEIEHEGEKNDANNNKSEKANGGESEGDITEDGDENLEDVPADGGAEAMPMNAEGETGMQAPASDAQEAPEGEGENDEWADYDEFKVGDNTYDLTGEEDYDKVVKVYKLMKDTDQIVVKTEGSTLQLQDNGTGEEYIIDLGDDEGDEELMTDDSEPMAEGVIKEASFDGSSDEDFELLLSDDEYVDGNLDSEDDDIAGIPDDKGKKTRKAMKENKEIVFEVDIHDYTDNYQNVDPIEGLSNDEPSKSGKSWEKGVPTGTKKPWAGDSKSKGKPFGKKAVDEGAIDEHESKVRKRSTAKVRLRNNEENPQSTKHASIEGSYKEVAESLMRENRELKNAIAAIKSENKELKETVLKVRTGLHEQRVTTVNLAKIVKLFTENAVSQSEKANVINRFSNEAKTIEQSKSLYESLDKEFKNKKGTPSVNINESMSVEPAKVITESKTAKSKDLLETLDFIKRMENC